MAKSSVVKMVAIATAIMGGILGDAVVAKVSSQSFFSQPTLAQTEPHHHGRALLVNITTDDTWTANMAISLAHTALRSGEAHSVTIFLNVRGVYLADSDRLPATEGNSELNIHQKLINFMADGGNVVACPSCSREAGLTQDDYLEGVVLGEPGGILPFLLDHNTAVMSY